jgi:hypothetical protein
MRDANKNWNYILWDIPDKNRTAVMLRFIKIDLLCETKTIHFYEGPIQSKISVLEDISVSLPRGWVQGIKRMDPVLLMHGLFLP